MSIDLCRWIVRAFPISSATEVRMRKSAELRKGMKAAALGICMLVQVVHAGKPGPSCSEIPVRWTMEYSSDYNLYGDGNPYEGTLLICGSGDVTMNLTRTSRYVNNAFSPLAATNSSSPAWAMNASTFTSQPFLNVRSILGYAVDQRGPNNSVPTQDYTLTTHFGGFFDGPDGKEYHYRWANTSAALAGTTEHVLPRCSSDPVACAAWTNTPWMTAKVMVAYTAGTKTWVVTPVLDEPDIPGGHQGAATLYFVKKNTNVNAGQFESFKFRFVIQAQ